MNEAEFFYNHLYNETKQNGHQLEPRSATIAAALADDERLRDVVALVAQIVIAK